MQNTAGEYVITADQLKAWRSEKDITQWELADAIGVPRNTIGTWEKPGGEVSKLKDIVTICKYFNKPIPGIEATAESTDTKTSDRPLKFVLQDIRKQYLSVIYNPKNIDRVIDQYKEVSSEVDQLLEKFIEELPRDENNEVDDTKNS